MNANPSGSRTPSTGGRGRSKPRRELARSHGTVAGPCPDRCLRRISRWDRSAGQGFRRRDAACQEGVSWGPHREARRPRKGRGVSSPASQSSSRVTSTSFGEHVRSRGRGPSTHCRPGHRPGPGGGAATAEVRRFTARGPAQRTVSRLITRRVTPSWSSPAATSIGAGQRALPRERSPCGMTIASLLLALVTAAGHRPRQRRNRPVSARLPRRVVRSLQADAPRRRAVGQQGLSRQVDRHRPIARGWRRATTSRLSPPSSSSTVPATSSIAAPARSPPPSWRDSTTPPRPRRSLRPTPTPTSAPDEDRRATMTRSDPIVLARARPRDRLIVPNERPCRRSRTVQESQALGDRGPDPRARQAFDRLRLGHDDLQHARGVADSNLCPHLQARRPPAGKWRRASFRGEIMVDLFDGNLQGTNPAMVHFLESVEGKAVDYDFQRDVGLIRIRPGRRLAGRRGSCRLTGSPRRG